MFAEWHFSTHACYVMFHGRCFTKRAFGVFFGPLAHHPTVCRSAEAQGSSSGLSPAGCTGDRTTGMSVTAGAGSALRQVGRSRSGQTCLAVKIPLDGENSPSPPPPPYTKKISHAPLSDGFGIGAVAARPVDVIQLAGQQLRLGSGPLALGLKARAVAHCRQGAGTGLFCFVAYAPMRKREPAECCYWDEGTSDPRWPVSEPGMEAPLSAPCCSTWSFLFFSPRALLAQPWRPGA